MAKRSVKQAINLELPNKNYLNLSKHILLMEGDNSPSTMEWSSGNHENQTYFFLGARKLSGSIHA